MQSIPGVIRESKPPHSYLIRSLTYSLSLRFVVSAEYESMNKAQPVLFRTYDAPAPIPSTSSATSTPSLSTSHLSKSDTSLGPIDGPPCAVYQAALATMAVLGHYTSQKIAGTRYISGADGNANPTEIARSEARRLFPGRRIDLLLSIGTGTKKPITAHNPRMGIRRYVKGSEKVHSSMKELHSETAKRWTKGKFETGVYFRFDVPHLASQVDNHAEPWKCGKLKKFCVRLPLLAVKKVTPFWGLSLQSRRRIIDSSTRAYLDQEQVREEMGLCMETLMKSYEKTVAKGAGLP